MPHDVIVSKWQDIEGAAHAGRLPFLAAAAHESFAEPALRQCVWYSTG